MSYKTICLNLLEQQPQLHELLRQNRLLLLTADRLGSELRARHLEWEERLMQTRPASNSTQITAEAMELALQEIEDRLSAGSFPENQELHTLDAAMAHIRTSQPA